jgi:mRNA-degrading endonuclease RelE of RelBE toxin-antitoxin system
MATSWSNRAKKDLEALTPSLQEKAQTLVARLDTEPALGKKLLGPLAGQRSMWLGRTHRIIYELDDADAHILTIPMRRDAYR